MQINASVGRERRGIRKDTRVYIESLTLKALEGTADCCVNAAIAAALGVYGAPKGVFAELSVALRAAAAQMEKDYLKMQPSQAKKKGGQ